MARRTVMLLTLAVGFVVMTAGTCPPEACENLPPQFANFCQSSELTETSDDTQSQLAVREEPSNPAQLETAAPEPERDGS